MNLKKWFSVFFFGAVFFMFLYFRLTPILNQSVPYTYDQGRDFQKTANIIINHDFTLLGPTTGIEGLFHGVWWYYFLTIPFLLSNGNPIGYSIFILFISALQFLLLYYFLKKEFNSITALFASLLLAGSSYFILMSFFVISSVQLLPLLLLLLFFTYYFLKTKKYIFQLLAFLSLGFLFESELPFFFIIPSFYIAILITKKFKFFFPDIRIFAYSLISVFIAIIPRLLFEISHNFLQTKAVFRFLLNPNFHTPKPFEHVLYDRIKLFWNYYLMLFPQNNPVMALVILVILLFSLIFTYSKLDKIKKIYLNFISVILICMFLFSLAYKDTFWPNYYEGLPYFYIVILAFGFYLLSSQKAILTKILPFLIVAIFFVLSLDKLRVEILSTKTSSEGLSGQIQVIDKLYGQNSNKTNRFCTRIYTPPVIPHTYNYLFDYFSRVKKFSRPTVDFVDDKCWYIFEKEPYQFRVDRWRSENIPEQSKLLKTYKFDNGTILELWQKSQ